MPNLEIIIRIFKPIYTMNYISVPTVDTKRQKKKAVKKPPLFGRDDKT